jgi:hypothetical protein
MYPTYPVYFFIAYLVLFLAVPVIAALGSAWRRAQTPRSVACPDCGTRETVSCDGCYAVRRHAAGEETELRVVACTAWPRRQSCGQHCV